MRDSREETLIHALANSVGSVGRVVEVMRYGINTNFSLQSVAHYLKENEEMKEEEKHRILKFLFCFYNF